MKSTGVKVKLEKYVVITWSGVTQGYAYPYRGKWLVAALWHFMLSIGGSDTVTIKYTGEGYRK